MYVCLSAEMRKKKVMKVSGRAQRRRTNPSEEAVFRREYVGLVLFSKYLVEYSSDIIRD